VLICEIYVVKIIHLLYFNVVLGQKECGNVRTIIKSLTHKPEQYKKSSSIIQKYIEE
jgi:hypothetical protein